MMEKPVRIVGIGGSVASASKSLSAIQAAVTGAVEAGAETELFDLHQLNLPIFNPELIESPPEAALRWADAALAADGLLWSSPMYHGTISGAFKNALDWLYLLRDHEPPYLADKVVGLISTAGGTQGLQAVNTMEFIVRSLRAWAVPLVVPVGPAYSLFDVAGNLEDNVARQQLGVLGSEVVRVARLFAAGRLAEAEAECAEAARRVGLAA